MLETLNGSVNWISGEPVIGLMKIRMVKIMLIMVVKKITIMLIMVVNKIINNDHDNHVSDDH